MGRFYISARGGPFFDGAELHPVGSVVEIPPEKYDLLLSDYFDPTDVESAQALLDFHKKHHEDKPKTPAPTDTGRVLALEKAIKDLPAVEAQNKAHAEADAKEAAARQQADAEAARNPDVKAAGEAKREAYAKAAQEKAEAYRRADDEATRAQRDTSGTVETASGSDRSPAEVGVGLTKTKTVSAPPEAAAATAPNAPPAASPNAPVTGAKPVP